MPSLPVTMSIKLHSMLDVPTMNATNCPANTFQTIMQCTFRKPAKNMLSKNSRFFAMVMCPGSKRPTVKFHNIQFLADKQTMTKIFLLVVQIRMELWRPEKFIQRIEYSIFLLVDPKLKLQNMVCSFGRREIIVCPSLRKKCVSGFWTKFWLLLSAMLVKWRVC